jgi:3-methyladenine DNA glycosylase AlkD
MSDTPASTIRAALKSAADPTEAQAMQSYMKSAMPFLGVPAPVRRRIVRDAIRAHPCRSGDELAQLARSLWRDATHRELRYAALDLFRMAPHRRLLTIGLLPLARELLADATWWDLNDELSGVLLPALLRDDPATMKPLMRAWARSADLWERRAAMLTQRKLVDDAFDAVLFYDCLLPSIADPVLGREFFICKGMGWALRERSYAAPDEVLAFCGEYADRLSPLTRREALKALRRKGVATV